MSSTGRVSSRWEIVKCRGCTGRVPGGVSPLELAFEGADMMEEGRMIGDFINCLSMLCEES